ncbi:multisubunit sodium/proton antiporter MrpF subunit [Glaciihabitans tibetensis]|uniref:Multisubunit sodium/proton antiporter MrpF subunit n=1 Tax=Glaciihabitans tibetensis TaxID=1266600 RepID=A0A2T0VFN7_9MICO|nr:monovalent cation/H+ antiporter complex subunit F [Glaciihabitans tibetensis]PRY69020.1 multisubunit sodium/proton antiporter MrpF subunit [Glaciihabitans tibetensis]
MTVLYFVVGLLFSVGALLALYRVVAGPSILDRMIASDVLLTTLMLIVGAEMVYNEHTRTIPVMLVLAATAMFATVAVARYVSKQDTSAPEERLNESDEQQLGESPVETTT